MSRQSSLRVMDVTALGAVGDGLHDDTEAIRATIDAVPNASAVTPSGRQVAGSGIVYFPSVVHRGGTAPETFEAVAVYRITDTVEVPGRQAPTITTSDVYVKL
jgi:polygalacturonase